MGKSNIMNLNNNTASERMGKPVRSNFLSKNEGESHGRNKCNNDYRGNAG